MNQRRDQDVARQIGQHAERSFVRGFLYAALPSALRPFVGFILGVGMMIWAFFDGGTGSGLWSTAVALTIGGLAFGLGWKLFRYLQRRWSKGY